MNSRDDSKIQVRVHVRGRVQGVGFRASTASAARQKKGLKGYVRNLEDGRVEAVFFGPSSLVTEMVQWCEKGPRSAQVDGIEVREESCDLTLEEFEIR